MLKIKEKEILTHLIYDDDINILNYLEKLKIKKRTFQYYIKSLNILFSKENFSNIHIKNDRVIFNRDEVKKIYDKYSTNIDFTRKDLIDLICLYAIFSDVGLNISILSDKLYMSRNTIKSAINEVGKALSKGRFLNLEFNDRVNILKNILLNKNIKNYTKKLLDIDHLSKIKEFIKMISSQINLDLNDTVYINLVSYIYCYHKFVKNDDIANYMKTKESEVIKEYYTKYFNNLVGINSIINILIGLSLIPDLDVWINQGYLLSKLIYTMSTKLGIDLTKDKILYEFLYPHLKVSIYRIKTHLSLNELYYKDLIDKKSEIFGYLKDAVKEIEGIYNIKFTDSELSLLCFHFEGSIERMKNHTRKRVLLVCGLGYGSSKILEYSLKEHFDIDIIDVLPVHMVSEEILNNNNIDYVLTTSDLNIRSVKINPLLKREDCEKLLNLGIKRKNNRIVLDNMAKDIESTFNIEKGKLKQYLLDKYPHIFFSNDNSNTRLIDMITPNKIELIDSVSNIEEGIEKVGEILIKNKACTKKYIEAMQENFKKFGTYIVVEEGVVVPHTNLKSEALKTDFAMLILKKPIILNKKIIKMFFTYSSYNNENHINILKDFYTLLLNEKLLDDISKLRTKKEIVEYFKRK